ncbi:MAG: hypothetical protein JAZ13_08220 [Candidatus Thiodiazotropha taylori]|nr:hypothetical protein [Candidatus Thiodiazotropha taylori]
MLEELAAKVEMEIEKLAVSNFKTSLEEMIDFHRFLLAAYITEDKKHRSVYSYAQLGYWNSLHYDWLRVYRRLFERAVKQLGREGEASYFVEKLMYATLRLLPSKSELSDSNVTIDLFDLQLFLTHRLEDWAVENDLNTVEKKGSFRARNKQKRYEQVIRSFIGSSESLLQLIPSIYGWDKSQLDDNQRQWEYYGKGWPIIQRHLRNTAYFLVTALWNNNDISAKHYYEALLQWIKPLEFKFSFSEHIVHTYFIMPDILDFNWNEVQDFLITQQINPEWGETPTPSALLGIILRNIKQDVTNVLLGVFIGWLNTQKNSGSTISYYASKLLEYSPPETGAEKFLVSIIRILLSGDAYTDKGYAATLDSFIEVFDRMSEREITPGRVYTPSTRSSREQLLEAWAICFASLCDNIDVNRISTKILDIFTNPEQLPNDDASIRYFIDILDTLINILNKNTDTNSLLIKKLESRIDAEAALTISISVLETIKTGLKENREVRIKQIEIDQDRLSIIENASQSLAFQKKTACFPVSMFKTITHTALDITLSSIRFSYDKALLTKPLMGYPASNEESWLAREVNLIVSHNVLVKIINTSDKIVHNTPTDIAYWAAVKNYASKHSEGVVLVINSIAEPKWIRSWSRPRLVNREEAYSLPKDLKIWISDEYKESEGYLFHMNEIPTFRSNIGQGRSYVIPNAIFNKITFKQFNNGKYIEALYIESDTDTWKGNLELKYAWQTDINNSKYLEINF